jgi:hypothetical protein
MSDFSFSRSLQDGVTHVVNFVPHLLGALVILIIGFIVAKAVSKVVTKALHRVRFDRSLHTSSAGNVISRMVESPSRAVGRVVYWLIYLAFISFAVSALNLTVLNQILSGLYAYVPHVIAAISIFLVASLVSVEATKLVQRVMARTATAKLISAVIPAITMSLAVFMILNELNIAKDIVNILFTAIVGSIALGLALAFGLGGRDAAKALLEQAVDTAKDNSDQVISELKQASRTASMQAQQTKNNLQK